MDAHSLPKRRASGRTSSANQPSLGDTAVGAKSARQVQSAPAGRGWEMDVVFRTQHKVTRYASATATRRRLASVILG